MDKQPLISVIVPIYKVEEYLNQCIDSIVSQTYHNLEIILVDDGSPDNCPKICDEWAEKDDRIKVLHLQNGGAGKARNIGLSKAQGEWVVFVDGDDYIHSDMIRHLYELLDDADLSECCIVDTFSDRASFSVEDEEVVICNAEEALGYLIDDSIFRQTPPNKLYKREIIKNIPFPEGNLIDDEFWTYKVLGECNCLKHSSLKLYAYRQQAGSVMHKKYSILRLQALVAQYERLEYLQERYPSLLQKAKIKFLLACIYHGQMVQKFCPDNEKKTAMEKIKNYYRTVRLNRNELKSVKQTQRLWISLAKNSFIFTCKIKNTLNIGL